MGSTETRRNSRQRETPTPREPFPITPNLIWLVGGQMPLQDRAFIRMTSRYIHSLIAPPKIRYRAWIDMQKEYESQNPPEQLRSLLCKLCCKLLPTSAFPDEERDQKFSRCIDCVLDGPNIIDVLLSSMAWRSLLARYADSRRTWYFSLLCWPSYTLTLTSRKG